MEDKVVKEKNIDLFKQSLLYEMAQEEYLEALNLFDFPTLISISHFDILVHYCSAAIKSHNPHPVPKYSGKNRFFLEHHSNFTSDYDVIFEDKSLSSSMTFESTSSSPNLHEPKTEGIDKVILEIVSLPEILPNGLTADNLHEFEYIPEMVTNLNKIPWRRIEVSFGGSKVNLLSKSVHEQLINPVRALSTPTISTEATHAFVDMFIKILLQDHLYKQ